jgi:hypothetical protein
MQTPIRSWLSVHKRKGKKESLPRFNHTAVKSVGIEVLGGGELHGPSVRRPAAAGGEDSRDLEVDSGIPHLLEDLGGVGLESGDHRGRVAAFVVRNWSRLREQFPKLNVGSSRRRQRGYLPEQGIDGSDRWMQSG